MSGPVRLRFDPCGTPPVSLRRRHPLEAEVRHLQATLRALTMIAGCRETERQRHRDEVADLERRIADLTRHSYVSAPTTPDHPVSPAHGDLGRHSEGQER